MEAQNQNILICTTQQAYLVRYNLGDYEAELKEDGFFRIHRGYLVSLGHIKALGKCELTLDNGTTLPVSRSKEKELKEALFRYVQKEAF
jgi:two-component system response regulator LytT